MLIHNRQKILVSWQVSVLNIKIACNENLLVNRYRRGLQTYPKAKTSKSGHAIFFSFFSDASERRVWLSAESKILASTFGRLRLYRLKTFHIWFLKNAESHYCRPSKKNLFRKISRRVVVNTLLLYFYDSYQQVLKNGGMSQVQMLEN